MGNSAWGLNSSSCYLSSADGGDLLRIPVDGPSPRWRGAAERLGGVKQYTAADLKGTVRSVAYHQDQVCQLAPDTEAGLTHPECQYAGFICQSIPACSVQSHPEFCAEFSRAVFEFTRYEVLTEEQTNAAIASTHKALDVAPIVGQFVNTLIKARYG